jgi:uncharacterized protein (DUF305 family)
VTTSDEFVTATTGDAAPTPPDGLDDDFDDERRGPGTALWIVLVIVALVLGGAIGWRITKAVDEERPGRDSVDVGLFQDMGTHHNQAIAMAFAYLDHGTDPLLRQIAGEILAYQASEIGVMNDHLAQWNQQGTEDDTAMGWMGMRVPRDEMTGLATAEQLDELRAARGAELDQLFTRLMIDHHVGGIHMAQFAAEHAETETARSWAEAMVDGQKGEISELNRWRVQHGFPAVPVAI